MTENSKTTPRNLGPHGIGDPDDLRLRKTELKLLIPQIRREIVRKEKCAKLIEDYQNCVLNAGLFLGGIKCKTLKLEMADCLEFWNDDDELFSRAKKQYLEERAEYRRTGVCKDNRDAIFAYVKEKQQQQEES